MVKKESPRKKTLTRDQLIALDDLLSLLNVSKNSFCKSAGYTPSALSRLLAHARELDETKYDNQSILIDTYDNFIEQIELLLEENEDQLLLRNKASESVKLFNVFSTSKDISKAEFSPYGFPLHENSINYVEREIDDEIIFYANRFSSIGVEGGVSSGKTSLLNRIIPKLQYEYFFVRVDFKNLVTYLPNDVQLSSSHLIIGLCTLITEDVEFSKKLKTKVREAYNSEYDSQDLVELFKEIKDTLIKKNKKPIYFVIDNFESVFKLNLSIPVNVIFNFSRFLFTILTLAADYKFIICFYPSIHSSSVDASGLLTKLKILKIRNFKRNEFNELAKIYSLESSSEPVNDVWTLFGGQPLLTMYSFSEVLPLSTNTSSEKLFSEVGYDRLINTYFNKTLDCLSKIIEGKEEREQLFSYLLNNSDNSGVKIQRDHFEALTILGILKDHNKFYSNYIKQAIELEYELH